MEVPALDREKKWDFTPAAKVGDDVAGGDVLGTVPGDRRRCSTRSWCPHGIERHASRPSEAAQFTVHGDRRPSSRTDDGESVS